MMILLARSSTRKTDVLQALKPRRKQSLGAVLAGDNTSIQLRQTPPTARPVLPDIQVPQPVAQVVSAAAARWQQVVALLRDPRHAYLQELTGEGYQQSDDEHELNHYLGVSAAGLGITSLLALLHSPLIVVALPMSVYVNIPLIKKAYRQWTNQRHVGLAAVTSVYIGAELVLGFYFASMLANTLYLAAEKLLIRSRDSSRKHLINAFRQHPRMVWVVVDGSEVQVPFEAIKADDVVVVGAGEIIPVDGTILSGMASVDQRILTGESQPAEKHPDDNVLATTTVLAGKIYLRVQRAGSDTIASQLVDILNQTSEQHSMLQSRGEAFAEWTAKPSLVVTALAMPLMGPSCAFGLATVLSVDSVRFGAPIGMLNHLVIAAQQGILVKDGQALERLHTVDTIVFDKTGTLTMEQPTLSHIFCYASLEAATVLAYAAAAEQRQTHPIAHAIMQAATEQGLELPPLEDASYQVGYGLKVRIHGQVVRVGSARFLQMEGIALPQAAHNHQQAGHEMGYSLVFVAVDTSLVGGLELHPTIRPEAREVVQQLRQRDITMYVISGDHELPTRQLARRLGIYHYYADTLPQDKASLIAGLQKRGRKVCFVGDGINDAIALQQADVSVSLKGASTAATDAAQIVLMDSNLHHLLAVLDMAGSLETNSRLNIASAMVPAAVCVGGVIFLHWGLLAAIMLYNLGLVLGLGSGMLPLVQYRLTQLVTHGSAEMLPVSADADPHRREDSSDTPLR